MAHGTPDWGVTAGQSTTFQLTDLGELAVRLGAPVLFDRRGDVVMMDSFEGGLGPWRSTLTGTGAAADISSTKRRSGSFAARLVTGNALNNESFLSLDVPYGVPSRFGAEVSFFLDAAMRAFFMSFNALDGTDNVLGQVRYYVQLQELRYLNSAGAEVVLQSGLNLLTAFNAFHTWKLVIDVPGEKYVRLLVDERAYDLSAIALRKIASTEAPHLTIDVAAIGNGGGNQISYFDDAIITQNEPA